MTRYYRNTGAPFTSELGVHVKTGQVFEPTDLDLARRSYKLSPVEENQTTPIQEDEGWSFPGFASAQAEQLAEYKELDSRAFTGREGTGADGKYTIQDVREVVRQEEEFDKNTAKVQESLEGDASEE